MHVLVVEDEQTLADAVARGLRAEGFTADVVHDGRSGYDRGHDPSYDAIVLDILLPEMNGYKVCENLRADNVWTPILMLTAKDGEYDEAEALDTGADDFLSKPFSFVVLVARLRALGRRGSTGPRQMLRAGDLEVDVGAHRARRGDTAIELTPRELALLVALLRRDGTTVAKRDLLADVWGPEFEGDPNIVEVYIGYLRRKIDEPFGMSSIETVRGVGYRIAQEPASR